MFCSRDLDFDECSTHVAFLALILTNVFIFGFRFTPYKNIRQILLLLSPLWSGGCYSHPLMSGGVIVSHPYPRDTHSSNFSATLQTTS